MFLLLTITILNGLYWTYRILDTSHRESFLKSHLIIECRRHAVKFGVFSQSYIDVDYYCVLLFMHMIIGPGSTGIIIRALWDHFDGHLVNYEVFSASRENLANSRKENQSLAYHDNPINVNPVGETSPFLPSDANREPAGSKSTKTMDSSDPSPESSSQSDRRPLIGYNRQRSFVSRVV